jgi:hypothetical protein
MYGKMKKLKKGMLVFLLIVLVVNYVPPVKGLLDFGQKYYYTTLHGEVQPWEMPSKQPNFEGALRRFELYKQENPATTDTVLYRTFKRNPLLIWRWHDYLFHPRYKLPYIDPEQITRK